MWENVQSGDFGPKFRNLEKTAKLKSPVSPVHSGDFGYTLPRSWAFLAPPPSRKSQNFWVRVPRVAPTPPWEKSNFFGSSPAAGTCGTRTHAGIQKGVEIPVTYLCATVPVNISCGCGCMGVLGVRVPHSSLYRDEVILIFLSLG